MAKILVVDDEPDVLTLVERILAGVGHDVLKAADGLQALKSFRANAPDLIITDMLMPGMEGIETLRTLRREAPSARVIVMSGGGLTGSATYLNFAHHLGADATLRKPFKSAELREAVARVLAAEKP